MAYGVILGLHIGAAIATLCAVLYALYAIVGENTEVYRPAALFVGGIAAFQVFSGTALAVLSPELSALGLSAHIVGYLSVCVAVEVLLFERMSIRQAQDKQNRSLAFPFAYATAPVITSCLLFVAAVSYGV